MKNISVLLVVVAPGLLLAACSKPDETAARKGAPTNEMSRMDTAAVSGSGTGTVTAVDAGSGKITLNHGAIPSAGWPAMEMTFAADPAIVASAKVGENVQFDMTTVGGTPTVTAIRPQ